MNKLKTTMTRSQRTRKINSKFKNLSKEDKEELNHKILDDLESDAYEELITSAESLSEFDEEEIHSKKIAKRKKKGKNKKKRRTKRDKRANLSKSKVNLKQMIAEMNRKEISPRILRFEDIRARKPSIEKGTKICKVCFNHATYKCPRCRDYYCNEFCFARHKEFVCAHIEYNYFY